MIIPKTTPNFTVGRGGFRPEKIILHIMDGTLAGTDSWFASPISGVSAHYGIGNINGMLEVHQYVKDEDTAFAQGKIDNPSWNYRLGVNPNKYCLSIEHEGRDLSKAPEDIISASVELIQALAARWNIPINRQNILGHYEIRITKPNCPATNKNIIDTIVRRCQETTIPVDKEKIKVEIKRLVDLL